MNVGIRKDLKKYIKDLEDTDFKAVCIDDVVQNLEEILRKNKNRKAQKKLRNEYIAVEASNLNDNGDTFEAIKNGYGLPPIGCKYVKVRK